MGTSDIALHRCLLAQQVRDVLLDETHLQWVLWFDDDMVGTSAHVRLMREMSLSLGTVAVTGMYCKHTSNLLLTCRRYPGTADVLTINLADDEGPCVAECVPVLSGMGCMLVPASHFLGVWDCSPTIATHTDKHRVLKAICASGPVADESGALGWVSEDQVYSQGLWQHAKGVYALPIVWGHLTTVPLGPAPFARFLSADETDDQYAGVTRQQQDRPTEPNCEIPERSES